MTSPAHLIRRASRLLNDQEGGFSYVAWSEACLLDYLNEGLTAIYNLRPSEFGTSTTLALSPGSKQELPPKLGTLLSIDSNIDGSAAEGCAEGEPVTMSASDMLSAFGGKASCANPDNCAPFEIKNWRVHKSSTRVFFVEPPVPCGSTVEVDATVSSPPAAIDLCDVGREEGNPLGVEFDSALVDWIVYRAMSQDNESQYAYNMAARHRNAFYAAINGGYTADSRIRSGSLMGQEANHSGSNAWRSDIRTFGR